MANQINTYRADSGLPIYAGSHRRTFSKPLRAMSLPSIPADYATAGTIIGEAAIFVALIGIGTPLFTASLVAVLGGAVVGLAAYAYANITNAPENEFISDIVDTGTGALVTTAGLSAGVAALPAPIQSTVIAFITRVTPFSRSLVRGLVPASQPLSAILTLLIAANVYQNSTTPPKFINKPVGTAMPGYPATGFVLTNTGNVCITFNGGATKCWIAL